MPEHEKDLCLGEEVYSFQMGVKAMGPSRYCCLCCGPIPAYRVNLLIWVNGLALCECLVGAV